eukprot:9938328-Heterocapsa_arctica.AAC.1
MQRETMASFLEGLMMPMTMNQPPEPAPMVVLTTPGREESELSEMDESESEDMNDETKPTP